LGWDQEVENGGHAKKVTEIQEVCFSTKRGRITLKVEKRGAMEEKAKALLKG